MLHLNQLIGFGAASGGGPATSLSFFNSSTASGATSIVLPSSIQLGDIIVVAQSASNTSGTVTDVTPSGYTEALTFNDGSSGGARDSIWYKISSGSDSGATVNGMTANNSSGMVAAVFRPNNPATSLSVGSIHSQMTSGDPTSQVCAASAGYSAADRLRFYDLLYRSYRGELFAIRRRHYCEFNRNSFEI